MTEFPYQRNEVPEVGDVLTLAYAETEVDGPPTVLVQVVLVYDDGDFDVWPFDAEVLAQGGIWTVLRTEIDRGDVVVSAGTAPEGLAACDVCGLYSSHDPNVVHAEEFEEYVAPKPSAEIPADPFAGLDY